MSNPLAQYFRRPAVYIKLPSNGNGYTNEDIDFPPNKELPIYPMTAIDEITMRTPDALYNGTAVVDIIKSCVPCFKNPWNIKNIDLDAVMIAIRSASSGDTLDVESVCPNCKETSNYGISLVGLLSNIKAGDYDSLLELGDLKVKFKPLSYKDLNQSSIDQLELQKSFVNIDKITNEEEKTKASSEVIFKITNLTIGIISKTIEYIETPNSRVDEQSFIVDFLKNCDKNVYNKIKDHSAELKAVSEIKPVNLKCQNCSHEYQQILSLNPTDFFG